MAWLRISAISTLEAVLRSVARVLTSGGWFAFATLHPCFEPPYATSVEVDGRAAKRVARYFEEGKWWPIDRDRLLARIGWHHRTLSTLLNMVRDAGHLIDRLAEPRGADQGKSSYTEIAEIGRPPVGAMIHTER